MLMDWFTVLAQIVNFLILVFLLKHFLYDRIIQAMDEREKRIQNRLDEAEEKSAEAEKEAESYREKQNEWDRKHREMMDQAKDEAEKERQSLIQNAREEAESLRKRWQESVRNEKKSFLRNLRQTVVQQVYAVSRRVMKDLADADTQERVSDAFLSRLKALSSKQKDRLGKAIRNNDNSATVFSGAELSQGERQKITRAVREELSEDAEVAYEIDPDLVMGIEIKGQGEKMAWSVAHYLDELEAGARELLDKEAPSEG